MDGGEGQGEELDSYRPEKRILVRIRAEVMFMLTHQLARNCMVMLLLAIAAGLSLLPGDNAEAQEEIDISGEWTVEGLLFTEDSCQMTVAQSGTLLAAIAECRELRFRGEIDPTTGELALTLYRWGIPFSEYEGTASNDALSMVNSGGNAYDPAVVEGVRKSAASERRNISGDWQSRLSGVVELSRCDTSIWHRGEELEITLDCGNAAGGSFSGTINMDTGSFLLSGQLLSADGELQGVASRNGRVLSAIWSAPSLGSGTLTSLLEQRTGGVVAIDCDGTAEGIQESCTYDTGDTFLVQVHIAEAPPDGYTSFELNVQWTPPQLAYRQSEEREDELLEPGCATADRGNGWIRRVRPFPIVTYVCLNPSGPDIRLSAGVPVELEFTCWAEGIGTLSLVGSNLAILPMGGIRSGLPDLIRPLKGDALVSCRPHDGEFGDIDCNGLVNSIDAAVLLQHDAGLLGPPACDFNGDMNQDGRITSIDAALILRRVAGLI